MFRWLIRNLWNILLAIILAVVVWVVAVNEANPNREDTFQRVAVAFINKPADAVAYDISATTVDITLNAPEATWAGLSARVISATVDLSAPGEELYPVKVTVLPESIRRLVRVVRIEPASIGVTVEPSRTVEIPVEVTLIGEPPTGYRVAGFVTQPSTVTVSGPESWVAQVKQAGAELSVQGASASLSQTLTLRPVDESGRPVDNVTLNPDRTALSVRIQQLTGYSNLTVFVQLTGTVASGYRLVEVKPTPPIVQVAGSPTTLAALPGFVSTEPIDINGAESNIVKDVLLDLPPDVALVGQQSVRVNIAIEPIVGSLTVSGTPITLGLQPGLSARVSPESVQVILEGALPVLDQIDLERDVRIILDLSGLGIGTHQVEPQIETPPGVTAQSVLPATVQVVIELAPRGTATPTPRPTPTARP